MLHEFDLAADAPVTGIEGNVEILWKIEVCGTGYGLASFMHPFLVNMARGQNLPKEVDMGCQ